MAAFGADRPKIARRIVILGFGAYVLAWVLLQDVVPPRIADSVAVTVMALFFVGAALYWYLSGRERRREGRNWRATCEGAGLKRRWDSYSLSFPDYGGRVGGRKVRVEFLEPPTYYVWLYIEGTPKPDWEERFHEDMPEAERAGPHKRGLAVCVSPELASSSTLYRVLQWMTTLVA